MYVTLLSTHNHLYYIILYFAKEDFLTDGVVWLKQLNKDRLAEGRMAARSFAESFCSWDSSVNMLENLLQSSNQDA